MKLKILRFQFDIRLNWNIRLRFVIKKTVWFERKLESHSSVEFLLFHVVWEGTNLAKSILINNFN